MTRSHPRMQTRFGYVSVEFYVYFVLKNKRTFRRKPAICRTYLVRQEMGSAPQSKFSPLFSVPPPSPQQFPIIIINYFLRLQINYDSGSTFCRNLLKDTFFSLLLSCAHKISRTSPQKGSSLTHSLTTTTW